MHSAELAILDWIQTHLRCEFLDMAMPWISWTANHGEIWILLAVVLVLLKGQRRHGAAVAFGLTLDLIACNLVLKPLIGRLRPFVERPDVVLLIPPPGDASFPSGHTAASFVPLCSLAQRCSGGSGAGSRCRLVGSKACGGRSGSDQS